MTAARGEPRSEALRGDVQFNQDLGRKMLWLAGTMLRDVENKLPKAEEREEGRRRRRRRMGFIDCL